MISLWAISYLKSHHRGNIPQFCFAAAGRQQLLPGEPGLGGLHNVAGVIICHPSGGKWKNRSTFPELFSGHTWGVGRFCPSGKRRHPKTLIQYLEFRTPKSHRLQG
jgi:hypothetical protein